MDKKAKLIACPCCGYKTILGDFEGCHVCGWEHDPFQVRYPDDIGANGNLTLRQAQRNFQNTGNARAKSSGYNSGSNVVSLREAQQNFLKFGKCAKEYKDLGQTPRKDDERDPNWNPLPPLAENA